MTDKPTNPFQWDDKTCRHILSLSGGKDSTALALYMRKRIRNMEYVFCDTGEELKETQDYLLRIEASLDIRITRLNPERPFRHYLTLYNNVLPDARTRWCTKMLKLRPFEDYVGDSPVYLYVGIRADEPHRTGYISTKPNIRTRFPFVEDGLAHGDILRLLDDSGLGLPEYYSWRSRSGCYFCFFQQRREWVGLMERHPDLYWKAAALEKHDPVTGKSFTWVQGESLRDLARPERVQQIKEDFEKRNKERPPSRDDRTLRNVFGGDSSDEGGCLVCHL